MWAGAGPAWGGARVHRSLGPLRRRTGPHSSRLQVEPAEAPTRNGSWTSCQRQPLPLSALPFLGQVRRPSSRRLGRRGGRWRGRRPGAQVRGQALAPSLGRSQAAVLGQGSRRGRPKPAGLHAPPCRAVAQPPLQAVALPLSLPPRSALHGRTQEAHQLPALSRGPAAPRASLAGSLAAASSSSSSSSSPSVNSSWLRP